MGFETAIQKLIALRLSSNAPLLAVVSGVYDFVSDAQAFPYVTIGEDIHGEWDTNATLGSDVSVNIHSWSRFSGSAAQKGRKQIKQIQGLIYAALHRAELTETGFNIISVDFVTSESFCENDGLTWHGVQTFRILIDKN